MSPEERANRIMDDIANNCSSLKDVADEIRQAENDALDRAADKIAAWKDESERQGMPGARQRWENAEIAIRYLKHKD